jgi:opacity protein-like surface antigen
LTIDRKDFNAPAIAVDIGAAASSRVDVVFGFEYNRAAINSEYRHFVDNNRLPITQRTRLQQVNLTAGARIALTPRGREVGRLAWIPHPVTPYVGAGAGLLRYRFDQSGDFVDFVDGSIFTAALRSSGWTPSTHVFAGADIKLRRRLFLTAEGRYLWATATLGQDFTGFDRMDLSGATVTAGVNILF